MNYSFKNHELLPLNIIAESQKGEVNAIRLALNHYDSYITSLSTCRIKDEYGRTIQYVDEDIRRCLEIQLTLALPRFTINLE